MSASVQTSVDNAAFAAQDLAEVKTTLDGIGVSADKVSKALSGAFASAIVGGKSFNETLAMVAMSLTKVFLNAGLQPLTQGLSSALTSGLSSLVGGGGGATIAPFAEGGVVSSPTFFGAGKSVGLMGERGAAGLRPRVDLDPGRRKLSALRGSDFGGAGARRGARRPQSLAQPCRIAAISSTRCRRFFFMSSRVKSSVASTCASMR